MPTVVSMEMKLAIPQMVWEFGSHDLSMIPNGSSKNATQCSPNDSEPIEMDYLDYSLSQWLNLDRASQKTEFTTPVSGTHP